MAEVTLAASLSVLCVARTARGEPPPRSDAKTTGIAWDPPSAKVHIVATDDRALHVSLEWIDEQPGPRIRKCVTPCVVEVWAGRYRIVFEATEETLADDRDVTLDHDGELVISPRSRALRTTGLVLGLVGPAMIAGGYIAAAEAWPRPCGSETTTCGSGLVVLTGLALFVGGIAMTPTGWILFGVSYASDARLEPKLASPAASFSVVPLRGGAGIGGTFVF